MPIPVLFMIQHLHQGGTEDHFYDLVTRLDRAQFEPHVIHFASPDGLIAGRLAAQLGLPKLYIPVKTAHDVSALRAMLQVRRYIKRHRIRVMVTFHFVADFIGTLATLGTGVRVVSSRRDMGFTRTGRQLLAGRWLDPVVTRYIAVSDAVRHAIAQQEHLRLDKIEVIHNGTDMDRLDSQQHWDIQAERAALSLAPTDVLVVCVANFNAVKRHVTLVEAWGQILQRAGGRPGARLLLVGDGPMRPQIEAKIQELKLDNEIILMGHSQSVPREMQMADIFILPSETEGFSNAIVQAMAYGKPVIACSVGGNPEAVLHEQTGLLIPPCEAGAMADALERLIQDVPLRERLGQAGRTRARTVFSIEQMMQRQQNLLTRVAQ